MTGALSVGREGDYAAVRSLTFDDVVVTYVVDGVLLMRPDTFFPAIPAEHWSRHPELFTTAGELPMSAGGLLVEIADTTLLVDAGVGAMTTDFGSIGRADCGSLLDVLQAVGRRPEDVELLAFTHLHFDHAGWAFSPPGTQGAKTFPNARYVLARREWAPYAEGEPGSEVATASHVISALASDPDLVLIDDNDVIVPGVRAIVTSGHSPGHTSYVITSRTGRRLIVLGDAFHITGQLGHPHWLSVADADAAGVTAARRRLLAELSEPNTVGFGFHFGDQPFGRVVSGVDGAPAWVPVPTSVLAPPPR